MVVKKYLALVMAICMMTLTACGVQRGSDQQISEQGVMEDTDQSCDVNDSSKENLEITASEENMTDITLDSLLTHPDDDTYFNPETNDWLITVGIRNYSDPAIPAMRVMELFSFDTSGNLVQNVRRETHCDGSQLEQAPTDEPDMYQTLDGMVNYYNHNRSIDYYNKYEHVSDKYYGYYSLNQYYLLDQMDTDFVDVFYSPGLLKDDTERVNPEDEIYNEFCRVGELTGSDYFIYNLRLEEHDDRYVIIGGKDVKIHDGYSVYTADIDCFDENGRNIAGYSVMVFDDENHVDDYFMRVCGFDSDHYLETGEVRFHQSGYEIASKDTVIMGNILYRKDSGCYNKGEAMTSTDGYFSIPYLTDSQIKSLTLMK